MKYLFPLLLLVLTLNSCEEDPEIIGLDVNRDASKFDVCHYSADTDSWVVINIAEISYLKAHIDHGDAKLVDADGDGWVSIENECVPGGDCDDTDPAVYPGAIEVCDGVDNNCDGIVDEGCNQNGFADYYFDTILSNFYRGTYSIIADFDCNSSLTNDGQAILNEGNLGGSSLIANSLAMNVLNLLDYNLYKTSGQIEYDDASGKMMDMLVTSGSSYYGVNVTKAVAFPYGNPYTAAQATTLLESGLADLKLAEANLSSSNPVTSSILFVFAWDAQHANVITGIWDYLDSTVKADVTMILMTTDGFDEFVYTGNVEEICPSGPKIGDFYQGGIVYYILKPGDIGYKSGEIRGLIAAPVDMKSPDNRGFTWYYGVPKNTEAFDRAIGTGLLNTDKIISTYGPSEETIQVSYAAEAARSFDGGGYTDWFLPSIDELHQLLLQYTVVNSTAVANDGHELSTSFYWSSTAEGDVSSSFAWVDDIYGNTDYRPAFTFLLSVRPIRYF